MKQNVSNDHCQSLGTLRFVFHQERSSFGLSLLMPAKFRNKQQLNLTALNVSIDAYVNMLIPNAKANSDESVINLKAIRLLLLC